MNETVNWFPVVNSPVSSVSLIIRRCEGPHQELLGVAHEVRALSWQAFFWRVKGRSLLDWDFVDPAKQDSANAVHKHSHEQSIAPLMPIRPFPVPLRVGVDVCNISRIRRIIAHNESVSSDRLERFLKRILTKPERLYFWDRFGPACRIGEKHGTVSEYLAGRYEMCNCPTSCY